MTTNLQRWQNYMRDVNSPDSFVDMGFYYMISCALGRRVWVNPAHTPTFPNLYVVLIGPPGVGKGRVIKPVNKFLKYWKHDDQKASDIDMLITRKDTTDAEQTLDEIADAHVNEGIQRRKPLIFVGPESVTYEALMRLMGNNVTVDNVATGFPFAPSGVYRHRSVAFCLEEWSSFVKKESEKILEFMLPGFDCGDYSYETKNAGSDHLRNIWIGMLAGTTPSAIAKFVNKDIIDDGFAARTLFVFEYANARRQFGIFEHDEEQQLDRRKLLTHLLKLSKLSGRAHYTPEAYEYMRWFFEEHLHNGGRTNKSPKLDSYYTRLDMHAHKMAMCCHFADSLEMVIQKDSVEKALSMLSFLEKNMHHALSFGSNPLGSKAREIETFLKRFHPAGWTKTELLVHFQDDLREDELGECLRYCLAGDKVTLVEDRYYYVERD